jgi:hypothetical protein
LIVTPACVGFVHEITATERIASQVIFMAAP